MICRMPEITAKADLPEDKHHIFDAIEAEQGRVGIPFSLLLSSPEVAGRVSHLRRYLYVESTLPPLDKNLAILVAARELDWEFGWGIVVGWCRGAGAREEVIDVIGHRRPIDSLNEVEALVVAYGREMLHNHRVSDATFEAARAHYGNQGLTELSAIMGYYTMVGCILNAFKLEARPGLPRLP